MIFVVVLLVLMVACEGVVIFRQAQRPHTPLTQRAAPMVCPYDGMAIVGDKELDQLTHMGCVNKARFTLEDLWKDQIDQHVQAALPPPVQWLHHVRQDRMSQRLAYHYVWSVTRDGREVARGEAPYPERARLRGQQKRLDLQRREAT